MKASKVLQCQRLYGDEAWSDSLTHKDGSRTLDLVSPTLFSGTFTAGMGVDTRWDLICPGALGAPHTMHYGWEGIQGGLGGPSRSLCTREKAVSTWVPPSPGP